MAYEQDAESGEGCRGVNETSVTQLGDGRLLAVSRSYYHDEDYPLYQSVSEDNGFTWQTRRIGLHGLCPCLRWVSQGPPGGTTVLAYHDRYLEHQERGGIYVAFSHDCGETWGYQTYVDGGAYPCLLTLASGEMFLAWYGEHTELKGAFFDVPFPTGMRAEVDAGSVTLRWDGLADDTHTYRVHRSACAEAVPDADTAIGEVTSAHTHTDAAVEPGASCYYVVTAWDGDEQVGKSWQVAVSI